MYDGTTGSYRNFAFEKVSMKFGDAVPSDTIGWREDHVLQVINKSNLEDVIWIIKDPINGKVSLC